MNFETKTAPAVNQAFLGISRYDSLILLFKTILNFCRSGGFRRW